MKTEEKEIKNYYLKEFSLFDNECIDNKIANIMTAIESGIFTASTKAHLEELEKQKKRT